MKIPKITYGFPIISPIRDMKDIDHNTDFTKLTHEELIHVKETWKPETTTYLKAKSELALRDEARNRRNDKIILYTFILTIIIVIATIYMVFFK